MIATGLVDAVLRSYGADTRTVNPNRQRRAARLLRGAAYHEAGHCCAKVALGGRMEIEFATIDPARANDDLAEHGRNGLTRSTLVSWADSWDRATLTVAGPIAEMLYLGRPSADRSEWRDAVRLLEPRQRGPLVRDTTALLIQHWPRVVRIAGMLLQRGTVDGATITRVLDDGDPR